MNVLFDTGSGLFWVINALKCSAVVKGASSSCPGQYRYLPSYSQTFRKATKQLSTIYAYGGGQVANTALNCSILGFDNLFIGDTLVFPNHPICAADQISLATSIAQDLPYDGIMGLAPRNDDPQALVNVVGTFIPQMKTVSFWYNRTTLLNQNFGGEFGYTQSTDKVGMVVFGYDQSLRALYNQKITTIPIIANQKMQSSWSILATTIAVGGTSTIKLSNSDGTILVDSGNPGANLPKDVWNSLYSSLNPHLNSDGSYVIDCTKASQLSPLTFTFNGASAPLILYGPQQVLVTSECKCLLIFTPDTALSFGSVFLASFYTVFDYENFSINFYTTENQAAITCTAKSVLGKKKNRSYFITKTRNRSGSFNKEEDY
jgi:hypothetical protein